MHRLSRQSLERLHDPLPADIEELKPLADLSPGCQVKNVRGEVVEDSDRRLRVHV